MCSSSAAIIPSAFYKGEKYYYFGIENNEVSAFGGKLEPKETFKMCAGREFLEESLGVFADKNKIEKIFKKHKFTEVKNITPKHKHTTYIVPINKNRNFIKLFADARKDKTLTACQKEMSEIIAVKADALKSAIITNKYVFKGHKMRPCVISTLKIAHTENRI